MYWYTRFIAGVNLTSSHVLEGMFDLAEILCRMPFLTQPSPFIFYLILRQKEIGRPPRRLMVVVEGDAAKRQTI